MATLTAGKDLVGCAYNLFWAYDSLRGAAPDGKGRTWQERTPAMAAGPTDHRWTMRELLTTRSLLRPGSLPSAEAGNPGIEGGHGYDHGSLECYRSGLRPDSMGIHPRDPPCLSQRLSPSRGRRGRIGR